MFIFSCWNCRQLFPLYRIISFRSVAYFINC